MIKNYTSNSPLSNIFNAIEKTLVDHKAKQIVRDYDGQGRIIAISFLIDTPKGSMPIKLPARFERVEQIFQKEGLKYKPEQPYKTAWANIRDWVTSQMALLDLEMVKMEEIFLPYMVTNEGKTYFEVIEDRGFKLESGKVEEGEVIA